jgi:hypothetical protein
MCTAQDLVDQTVQLRGRLTAPWSAWPARSCSSGAGTEAGTVLFPGLWPVRQPTVVRFGDTASRSQTISAPERPKKRRGEAS